MSLNGEEKSGRVTDIPDWEKLINLSRLSKLEFLPEPVSYIGVIAIMSARYMRTASTVISAAVTSSQTNETLEKTRATR